MKPSKAYFGPRFQASDQTFLSVFNPPEYQPYKPEPGTCPYTDLLFRNRWETMNLNGGVQGGGLDQFSMWNVPSCKTLHSDYAVLQYQTPSILVKQRGDFFTVDPRTGKPPQYYNVN